MLVSCQEQRHQSIILFILFIEFQLASADAHMHRASRKACTECCLLLPGALLQQHHHATPVCNHAVAWEQPS
jgi:hypothetical protein